MVEIQPVILQNMSLTIAKSHNKLYICKFVLLNYEFREHISEYVWRVTL